jgi:hypothetical protein
LNSCGKNIESSPFPVLRAGISAKRSWKVDWNDFRAAAEPSFKLWIKRPGESF